MVVTESATSGRELDSSNMVVTEPAIVEEVPLMILGNELSSNGVPLPATPVSDLRWRTELMEDLNQLCPSQKRSICGIDYGYPEKCIAGAVEDDELLGSSHLKSVVDNVFISDGYVISWRDNMMRRLNNKNVSDCCIGIPIHYTCKERRHLLRAATAAGWRPCKLLHTTTAAALMYRFSSADLLQDDTLLNIAFINMGKYQGTQVSIVGLRKDQLEVLSHAYDRSLCRYEFDEVVDKRFSSIYGLYTAESLKERLSTQIEVGFGGIIVERVKYEKLSSTLLERVREVLQKALNESGIRVDDVHSVQVVGKGSKIPTVMTVFRDFFGKEPRETILESYPVATGCFIHCAMLCGAYNIPKFQIVDILPYSIQLDDATEKQVLFPKGHPIIPSIISVTFRRTFFLDLICNYSNEPDWSPEMISYMIGPFHRTREEDVNVKVQLDLHGISYIESATITTTLLLQGDIIIPVVKCEVAGPDAEQQKLLIDYYEHEFVKTQDKIIAAEKFENEKLRESKVLLEIQLTESNALLETTTKQHEEIQSSLLDKVQKAERKLVDISAQYEGTLEHERREKTKLHQSKEELETTRRNEVQKAAELTMQLTNSLDVETNRKLEVDKNLEKEMSKREKLQQELEESDELQTAYRNEVEKIKKDFVDISARLNTQDKIIAAERSEKGKLHESKVALVSQLTEFNARLETTTKKHEELQTALRDKVQKAEKKLVDISAQLTSSLNDETKRRKETEKMLEDEKSKSMKLQIERKKVIKERDDALEKVDELSQMNFAFFNLSELKQAKNNFDSSYKIGEGGYGSVYKGTFLNKLVAIKILKKGSSQGEAEFNQEVTILSNVRHPNLVALLGASLDARALVYEFLPNGSLDSFLTGTKNFQLSWQDRIRIAFEICSVLIFLHSLPPHGIAHGDLKPENVLLDSNLRSKLSDFGTCRKLQLTGSTNTPIHPTERPSFSGAYVDPEYLSSYNLTPRSDTFAFGIILLQLITGAKPRGIRDGVEEKLKDNSLDTIVDGAAGEWPIEEAKKLAQLGLDCSDQSRRKRPDLVMGVLPLIKSMKDVAESTLKESISDNALS